MPNEQDAKQALGEARATRERAARALRQAADLLKAGAAPATCAELARWVGISTQKVRDDERAGAIRAKVKKGKGSKMLFARDEAVRYLRAMGVL
jgi:hypothetical protein